MTLRASTSFSPTPLTLQAVAAIILVMVVVLLLAGMFYLLLAASVAWALMVLQGLLWVAAQGVRRSWTTLRRHVRRAASSAAAPDRVLRPSH